MDSNLYPTKYTKDEFIAEDLSQELDFSISEPSRDESEIPVWADFYVDTNLIKNEENLAVFPISSRSYNTVRSVPKQFVVIDAPQIENGSTHGKRHFMPRWETVRPEYNAPQVQAEESSSSVRREMVVTKENKGPVMRKTKIAVLNSASIKTDSRFSNRKKPLRNKVHDVVITEDNFNRIDNNRPTTVRHTARNKMKTKITKIEKVTPTSIAQIVPNLNINSQKPINKITPRRLFQKREPSHAFTEHSPSATKKSFESNDEIHGNIPISSRSTGKSKMPAMSSCSNKTSTKSRSNKKAVQTRKEIEQLKTELQALIDSNSVRNSTSLDNKPEKITENKRSVESDEEKSTEIDGTKDIEPLEKKRTPDVDAENDKECEISNPSPKIKRVKKKPSSPSIESTHIVSPVKIRHYDPKQAREYMKKQRRLRRNKLLEEIDSKKRLQEEKKRKLKELQENTLKILINKNNQKKVANVKRAEGETNTEVVTELDKHPHRVDRSYDGFKYGESIESDLNKIDASSQLKLKTRPNSIDSLRRDIRCRDEAIRSVDVETDSLDSVSKRKNDKVSKSLQSDSIEKDLSRRHRAACKIQSVYRSYLRCKNDLKTKRSDRATVDIETQTNLATVDDFGEKKDEKTPVWLRPAASLAYPFNFISAVKQKLNCAINSQRLVDNTDDGSTLESRTFRAENSSNKSSKSYSDSFRNTSLLNTNESIQRSSDNSIHLKEKSNKVSRVKKNSSSISSNIDYSMRKHTVFSVSKSLEFDSNDNNSLPVMKSVNLKSKTSVSASLNSEHFKLNSIDLNERINCINESDIESHTKISNLQITSTDSSNDINSIENHHAIESQNEITSSKVFSFDFPDRQVLNKNIRLSEDADLSTSHREDYRNPLSSIVEDLKLDLRGINSDTSHISQDLTLSDNEIRNIIHSLSRRKHSGRTLRSKNKSNIENTVKSSNKMNSSIFKEISYSTSENKEQISPTGESINTNSTGRDVESAILSSDKNFTSDLSKSYLKQNLISTDATVPEEKTILNENTENVSNTEVDNLKSNSSSTESMKKSTDSESSSKHLTAAQMLSMPSDKLDVDDILKKNIRDEGSVVDNVKSLVSKSTNIKLHPNVTIRDHRKEFSTIDVKQKSNEICLKFQAEFRLLDSFNESLNRIQEMNKELLTKNNQKSENKRTQTSLLSDVSKNRNKSESIVENLNSIVETINRSIRSIQSYSTDTVSKPTPSVLTERSSVENIISELKSASSSNLSQNLSVDNDIDNVQTIEPALSTSFEISKIADSFSSGLDTTLINISDEARKANINDLPNITVDMIEQQIRNEDAQLEHFKTLLKLREKALIDRTKGELAWLELTKKQLRNNGEMEKASAVKKKQRGILLKLQQEKHEMQRLKQMHIASSQERKIMLKEQKTMIKKQLSTKEMLTKFKRYKPIEHKRIGPLKVYSLPGTNDSIVVSGDSGDKPFSVSEEISIKSSRTVTSEKNSVSESVDFRKSVTIKSNNQIIDANRLKKVLLKREQDLQKRRRIAEELLEWHRKLSEEEKHVIELEKEAKSLAKNTAKSFILKGCRLNRLWCKITGIKEIKYSPEETYVMTKQDLDAFYEKAKRELFKRIFVTARLDSVESGVNAFDLTSTDVSDERVPSESDAVTGESRKSVPNKIENRPDVYKSSSEKSNSVRSIIEGIESESFEPFSDEDLSKNSKPKSITASTQSVDNSFHRTINSKTEVQDEASSVVSDNKTKSPKKLSEIGSEISTESEEISDRKHENKIINSDRNRTFSCKTKEHIQKDIQVENIVDSSNLENSVELNNFQTSESINNCEFEKTSAFGQLLLHNSNFKDNTNDVSVTSSSIENEQSSIKEENSLIKSEISFKSLSPKQNDSFDINTTVYKSLENNLLSGDESLDRNDILQEYKSVDSEIIDNISQTNVNLNVLKIDSNGYHASVHAEQSQNKNITKGSNVRITEETDVTLDDEVIDAVTLSNQSDVSEKESCAKSDDVEKSSIASINLFNLKTKTEQQEIDSASEILEVIEKPENSIGVQICEQNSINNEVENSIDNISEIQSNSSYDSKRSEQNENRFDTNIIKPSTENRINKRDSIHEHYSSERNGLNVSSTSSSSNNKSIYSGCETPVHDSKNSASKFNNNAEYKLPVENSSIHETHVESRHGGISNDSHCLNSFEKEFSENNKQNIQSSREEYKKSADVPPTVTSKRENSIVDELSNSTQIPDIVKSHVETKKSSVVVFGSERLVRSVKPPETFSKKTLVSEYESKFKGDILESPIVPFEDAVLLEREFETSMTKEDSSKVDVQSDFERASQKTISSGEIQSEVEEYSIEDEENESKVALSSRISLQDELNDSFESENEEAESLFKELNVISEKINDRNEEILNDNIQNDRSDCLNDKFKYSEKQDENVCSEEINVFCDKSDLKISSLSNENKSDFIVCKLSNNNCTDLQDSSNDNQLAEEMKYSEESDSYTDVNLSSVKFHPDNCDFNQDISSDECIDTTNTSEDSSNEIKKNSSIDLKNDTESVNEKLLSSFSELNLVIKNHAIKGNVDVLKSSKKIKCDSDFSEYSPDSSKSQIEIEVIEERINESQSKSKSDRLNFTIEKIKIESNIHKNRCVNKISQSNSIVSDNEIVTVNDDRTDRPYKTEIECSSDLENSNEEKGVDAEKLRGNILTDIKNSNESHRKTLNENESAETEVENSVCETSQNCEDPVKDCEETSKDENQSELLIKKEDEIKDLTFSLPVCSLSDESLLDNITSSNILDATESIDRREIKSEKSVESDNDTASYEESFVDDSKSKRSTSSSSDNSQVTSNDSVRTSSENDSSGGIDVRKRVREILADASSAKNGQKNPRVQDLWITTYDIPSSPELSPESVSPVKEVSAANLPIANESIVSEAEELRRKQLEIEQEIKELEKQQNDALPFVYVREIPNKPPPPYTPPSPQLTHSVTKNEKVPVLRSKTVTTVVTEIADTLYDAYSKRIPLDHEPSLSFLTFDEKDGIDVSSKRFLFDLCRDIVRNDLIVRDEEVPSWRKEKIHKNVKRPKSKSEFVETVDEKVKQLLGLSTVSRKENLIICWSRKKRDHVDELLVRELQVEEAEWTNFDNDEITVKNELTDDIFDLLIADTVSVTTVALEKKIEKFTSL